MEVRGLIEQAFTQATSEGITVFHCGMAPDFDLIAGESILKFKIDSPRYRNIRLIPALPFPEHTATGSWAAAHARILDQADEVVHVTTRFSREVYLSRNRFMVDRSSLLICWFDGKAFSRGVQFSIVLPWLHSCEGEWWPGVIASRGWRRAGSERQPPFPRDSRLNPR